MFYQKVIEYCNKNNISVHEFEQKCELGNGTVGRWKDGKSQPTISTLQKVAFATKIPISQWVKE